LNLISILKNTQQKPWLRPSAVFLFGCLLSLANSFFYAEDLKLRNYQRFEHSSHRLVNELRLSLQWHQDALRDTKQALSQLHRQQSFYTEEQFQQALKDQQIFQLYPQLQNIVWIQTLPANNANAFIIAQKVNHPNFQLRQFVTGDQTRNEHTEAMFVAQYAAPKQMQHDLLGWDLASESAQRTTLEFARDHGQTAISHLLNFAPYNKGILMAEPVYSRAPETLSVSERRQALIGFLVCVIKLNTLVLEQPDIRNQFLEVEFVTPTNLTAHPNPLETQAAIQTQQSLHLFGSQIQLHIRAGQATHLANRSHQALLLFFLGFGLSILLAYSIWERSKLTRTSTTTNVDRSTPTDIILHTLKQHLFVFEADLNGNFIDVNDAFCAISGFSKEILLRHNVQLLNSHHHPDAFWHSMWDTIAQGKTWRAEVCNRNQKSELFWVDQFVIPIYDQENKIEKFIAISIDISASKNAATELESALRESNALLSALNMHAIVSIADSVGKIIDVNPAYCRISGYSREEILTGNHRLITTGIQSPDFLSHMWRTISSGTPWRGEVCNRHKNGSLYWVDTFIAPFKNAKGNIEKFISIRTDITTSKKAASRLASQRSALANIIEGTNVGTWEWNVETGEVRINERWCDQIGYEISELTQFTIATWDGLTHPEDLPKAKKQFQMHFKHELPYYEFETRMRHKNGHWIWVQTRGRLSSFTAQGRPEWMAGTQMDITERKLAEMELQRSTQQLLTMRDQLSKAAEVAELGVWTWHLDVDMMICNERMYELYEATDDMRINGMPHAYWRSRVHPDDIDAVESKLRAVILGTKTFNPIFRIITSTKGVRYIQAAGGVEHDQHGKATLITGINRDITLQYKAEEALRQAKQAADDANRAKSAFLANMSHEIRTPMNAILGMLTLLRKTTLSTQQSDYTSKTENAARSLLTLLNDILDISKVESGKMTLDPTPFNIEELLRDLAVILSINLGSKPVEIIFDIDAQLPNFLIGDAMRLKQVLTNLCSNAIKFTEQGLVKLSIQVIQQDAHSVSFCVEVSDTGIGIAPENQQRIFDSFTQAEASTTRRFGGTGLGVAISQRFVRMMGGELSLESALDQGSRFQFTITLPIAEQVTLLTKQQNSLKLNDTDNANDKPNLRLLLIHEHPESSAILHTQCQTLGWHLDSYSSFSEAYLALEQTEAGKIDFLLLNWQNKDFHPLHDLTTLKQLAQIKMCKLIALMNMHDREYILNNKAQFHGLFDGYLIKPITKEMLFEIQQDRPLLVNPAQEVTPYPRRLQQLRILLVEDNITNQQVARELLEGEGALVWIAHQGQAAVEMIASGDIEFNVVLMDIQMPVMDGYSATDYIRNRLGQTHLPIIAMTANAMESDRAACLEAGLSDHVGKPFNIHHLVQIILKHTHLNNSNQFDLPFDAPLSEHIKEIATTLNIQLGSALNRLGGKRDLYQRMLRHFTEDIQRFIEQLLEEPQHKSQLLRQLHTYKGLAATLGITRIHDDFEKCEKQLQHNLTEVEFENELRGLCDIVSSTNPKLETLLDELEKERHQHHNFAQVIQYDAAQFKRKLLVLLELLENADMAATDSIDHFPHVTPEAMTPLLNEMKIAIADLDFERALVLCQQLLESDLS
jgi:PAS domain S-box-containing protein